jgi:hypothetical protein
MAAELAAATETLFKTKTFIAATWQSYPQGLQTHGFAPQPFGWFAFSTIKF